MVEAPSEALPEGGTMVAQMDVDAIVGLVEKDDRAVEHDGYGVLKLCDAVDIGQRDGVEGRTRVNALDHKVAVGIDLHVVVLGGIVKE